jgi:hypothetical protein
MSHLHTSNHCQTFQVILNASIEVFLYYADSGETGLLSIGSWSSRLFVEEGTDGNVLRLT